MLALQLCNKRPFSIQNVLLLCRDESQARQIRNDALGVPIYVKVSLAELNESLDNLMTPGCVGVSSLKHLYPYIIIMYPPMRE